MVDTVVHPNPVRTRIIRSPAAGPDPANTLAYLDCEVAGAEGHGQFGRWYGVRDVFRTEFKIDGFQQQHYDWYAENTIVSATAMLRLFNTTTDLIFSGGLDEISPTLEADGTLGFTTLFSIYADDEAWFPASGNSLAMSFRISAYVLCFEPRTERPPSGRRGSIWGRIEDVAHATAVSASLKNYQAATEFKTTFEGAERARTDTRGDDDRRLRPRVRRRIAKGGPPKGA